MDTINKQYIGREEAYELMMERGIDNLPRKGREVLTVPAIATGLPVLVLGKDHQGYYTAEMEGVK